MDNQPDRVRAELQRVRAEVIDEARVRQGGRASFRVGYLPVV